MDRRVGRLMLLVGLPCFVMAGSELLLADSRPGISLPGLKTALEAVQAMVALLVAFLLYGRVQRRRPRASLADCLLLTGFLLLAASSLLILVDLLVVPGTPPGDGVVWGRVVLRLCACATVAAAALAPDRAVERSVLPAFAALWVVSVGTAVGLTLAEDRLPAALRLDDHGAVVGAAPLVRVALSLVLVLTAVSALGFRRRAVRVPDPMSGALAVAFVVNTASFLAFVGRPSLYTDRVHLGDALRVVFWLIVLTGAAREVVAYWRSERDLAVLEERRRVARELHDGLAQELAFITQQAQLLHDGEAPDNAVDQVLASARRALDESRRAIAVLRDSGPEPLALLLRDAAEDVAARAGIAVDVEVDPDVVLGPDVRETVVRIMREAIWNAARHGRARMVRVRLGDDRVLRVIDDGVGFDVARPVAPTSYGIVTMRERAGGIGGQFDLHSQPGSGTSVEVTLP